MNLVVLTYPQLMVILEAVESAASITHCNCSEECDGSCTHQNLLDALLILENARKTRSHPVV